MQEKRLTDDEFLQFAMDAEPGDRNYYASVLFGIATAPFIGCITSLILFVDPLADQFWWAFPFFIIGAVIIVKEQWKRKEKTGGNPSQ